MPFGDTTLTRSPQAKTTSPAAMNSRLYFGDVRHRRFHPRPHDFKYRLFMVYLDLDEIERIFQGRWFWSSQRPNLAWFRREDYLGEDRSSLRETVCKKVTAAGGPRPQGPIRMLTHLRYFGYGFNPVTFYYCFTPDGHSVESIIAEITNTPWDERKAYVLTPAMDEEQASMHRFQFAKTFHVSPFLPMDLHYDWRFSTPGQTLNVHMRLDREQDKVFDATLKLKASPLSSWPMARALLTYPLMTLKVIGGIYLEALKLKLKQIPVFDHPNTKARPVEDTHDA